MGDPFGEITVERGEGFGFFNGDIRQSAGEGTYVGRQRRSVSDCSTDLGEMSEYPYPAGI